MFTLEELQLLYQIVRNIPVTGTVDTLPSQIAKLVEILRKIEVELQKDIPPKSAD